ncbi:MAG: GNAT family N-acetyltransferase [Sulfitobacter sp.]|nr:GNAT family N-acetyltransferase [Sulfitobacter sp.]
MRYEPVAASATAPIRPITVDDAPACAAILVRWLAQSDWNPSNDSAEVIERALREGLPHREAWGIGDPAIAYISINAAENHIGGFYVDQPGVGIGKRLMDKAKEARDALSLNTHLANSRAQAFYRREGFVPVGEPFSGNDGIPEQRMEWRR